MTDLSNVTEAELVAELQRRKDSLEQGEDRFIASNLSVLAYANNFTLWHYVTKGTAVDGAGYFNYASDMLRANDLIICATAAGIRFYIVTGNAPGVVCVAAYA